MKIEEFNNFRLVGGTSLSLQLGHRESIDIDLFTDAEYGSIDFKKLEQIIRGIFPYVESPFTGVVAMGTSFFIGEDKDNAVKLDLFYTDPFIFDLIEVEGVRLAPIEEIAAMKFEVIANGGRKKDFWDIHELFDTYTLDQMLVFYEQRNPYGDTVEELRPKCLDFSNAEDDFLPNCYRDKIWEFIKLDFEEKCS
jgi:hypothetical protein